MKNGQIAFSEPFLTTFDLFSLLLLRLFGVPLSWWGGGVLEEPVEPGRRAAKGEDGMSRAQSA